MREFLKLQHKTTLQLKKLETLRKLKKKLTSLDKIFSNISSKECLSCKEINLYPGCYCPKCWSKLNFIEYNLSQNNESTSILNYNKESKKIIHGLKYYDEHQYLPFISKMCTYHIKAHEIEFDYIIPVPLSRRKLLKRKFNQVNLIAEKICRDKNNCKVINALSKKYSISQTNLSRIDRKENVANKFFLKKNSHLLKDKNILLLDDVMTSGATLNECRKILEDANPRKITTLSFTKSFAL